MDRTNLRQKIINELLRTDKLSVKLLCERTGASRVSVSKELAALTDAEIISKPEGSRAYLPAPKIAFVIFKLYFERAELITYSLDGTLYNREQINLLYSLAHDDNIAFLLPRIKRCRESLKNRFDKVFTFIIHDKIISPMHLALDFFNLEAQRSELVARYLAYTSSKESVLYINNISPLSFICQNKQAVTPSACPTEKALRTPQSVFSFIKPNRVILEGKECPTLESTCAKHNVHLEAVSTHSVLYSDELEIIAEFLFSISKIK